MPESDNTTNGQLSTKYAVKASKSTSIIFIVQAEGVEPSCAGRSADASAVSSLAAIGIPHGSKSRASLAGAGLPRLSCLFLFSTTATCGMDYFAALAATTAATGSYCYILAAFPRPFRAIINESLLSHGIQFSVRLPLFPCFYIPPRGALAFAQGFLVSFSPRPRLRALRFQGLP